MVALDAVKASNVKLRQLGPNLVALFVGATSGIGEYTAKEFVKNAFSPRAYIVGRNQEAAERIIAECKELNRAGKVEFLKADVTELSEVDRVCAEIRKKESHINLLVQSQGNMNLKGRDENSEGLDRKFTLNFYSRMRFIHNLLPLLTTATTIAPHFSRSLSILGAGDEGKINLDDLDLQTSFSPAKCAAHTIVMNDFMTEEFSARTPGISFVHSFPGLVNTGLSRELPLWARLPAKALTTLFSPIMVGAEETGARQLFIATSAAYPPAKPVAEEVTAKGVEAEWGRSVMPGVDGKEGSGAYIVNWNNEPGGKKKLLAEYREKGIGKAIWEHTMATFDRVDKLNQQLGKTSEVIP
ncbi:hypothetical protein B0O99DRAFT_628602 [Bisporella sp. PMI_857]|nr:hypothetical protein B0O99DRAFT_628602 [Bisporella sp. PMI_857]